MPSISFNQFSFLHILRRTDGRADSYTLPPPPQKKKKKKNQQHTKQQQKTLFAGPEPEWQGLNIFLDFNATADFFMPKTTIN